MKLKSVSIRPVDPDRHHGFTVIELLGVTATIAILAMLLMPTLAKSKEKGQQIRCLRNMQQLMRATHLYANDFNNFLPFSGAFPPPQFYTNCWAYSHNSSGDYPDTRLDNVVANAAMLGALQSRRTP